MVRWRMRASSVVPGAAVKPNRARVSTTRPVLVAACFLASARMRGCQRADGVLQALREVGAGPADLVFDVPLHGALRDAERVTHLRARRLGDGAGERPLDGAVEAVSEDAHWASSVHDRPCGPLRGDHARPGELPGAGRLTACGERVTASWPVRAP